MPQEKYIAMIPARLGSQRLKKKNLAPFRGEPLIVHAIRKCREANCFDEIWVNTESDLIGQYAVQEGVGYHKRPAELANNVATSEDFVAEFLQKHPCDAVFQVHSIAPLLSAAEVRAFVEEFRKGHCDVLLSCVHDQIEVAYRNRPVNFTFTEKTNSQDLTPVQRITWAITAWRRDTFLEAVKAGKTATYYGRIAFYPLEWTSGHVIKTQLDLDIAEALDKVVNRQVSQP